VAFHPDSDQFATAGADRLMAVDLHTSQIQGFFDGPVDHLIALPVLAAFKRRVDPRRYNGATLIGLKGVVVKSHGHADALAFRYALKKAYTEVAHGVLERIAQRLAAMPVPAVAPSLEGSNDA